MLLIWTMSKICFRQNLPDIKRKNMTDSGFNQFPAGIVEAFFCDGADSATKNEATLFIQIVSIGKIRDLFCPVNVINGGSYFNRTIRGDSGGEPSKEF